MKFYLYKRIKIFHIYGILLRGAKMKVFYLLFLSGLLAAPAYAEDDILSATEDSVVVASGEAESTETAANGVEKVVDTAEEKVDLLQATETPEDMTVDTAEEKVDLLQATETSEDTAAATEKESEALPEDFKEKLNTCTPATTSRNVNNQPEKIEIRGEENDNCKIRLMTFDLNIPMVDLPQIKTYEDLEELRKNPEISTLVYADKYNYANLMSELNQCKGYQFLHHNGRATTEYPAINVTLITDMTAQLKEDICELTFVNEITVDGKFMNYTVVCKVPEEKIAELLEPYRDLVDLYGAKEIVNADGSISSRTAVSNEKTSHVDAKLMYELQTAGYCGLLETSK